LKKSSSVESYFSPCGTGDGQGEVVVEDEVDPERPINCGWLDECDREKREDISWSTPVSPKFGPHKKRKSPIAKEGIDVWRHVGRIKSELHTKYGRVGNNLAGYTHACYHCGTTLALGWSKKTEAGERLKTGCWQTTVAHRHLRNCVHLPLDEAKNLEQNDKSMKKVKLEKGVARNMKVSMPLKLQGGEVVFSASLEADTREAVKVAIARVVIYSQTKLPDCYLDCPFHRDMQRLLYKAGFEDALSGKKDSTDYPSIGSRAVADYVESEDAIQRAYGRLWGH
jgi:hypothetical protein